MKPISLITTAAATATGLLSLALLLVLVKPSSTQQLGQQATSTHRVARNNNNNQIARQLAPKLSAQSSSTLKSERSINGSSSLANGRLEAAPFPSEEEELPADFYEMPPEQLDLGMNATGTAPVPILNVAVFQNGEAVSNSVTVQPGTPLEMVIYLDDKSAKVYGLLASYLKVKDDTFRQREETIILNGCSIDTYIFGNFELNPEDQSLRAKFRAFKFPESNFVRFIGTVNVCIKQCAKVNCGGPPTSPQSRRRRSTASSERLVQLTVSTVLKIGNGKQ